jgi:hypothetical protein
LSISTLCHSHSLVVAALAGLAHEHQLDISRLLVQAGARGLSTDEIWVRHVMNDVLSYLLANCQAATGPLDAAKVSSELAKKKL